MSVEIIYSGLPWTAKLYRKFSRLPNSRFAHVKYSDAKNFPKRILATDSKMTWLCEACTKPFTMWYTDDSIWQQLPPDQCLVVKAIHCPCQHCAGRVGQRSAVHDLAVCVDCFRGMLDGTVPLDDLSLSELTVRR